MSRLFVTSLLCMTLVSMVTCQSMLDCLLAGQGHRCIIASNRKTAGIEDIPDLQDNGVEEEEDLLTGSDSETPDQDIITDSTDEDDESVLIEGRIRTLQRAIIDKRRSIGDKIRRLERLMADFGKCGQMFYV